MRTTFRDFMEAALYAPGDGYYPRRASKADFYTAPELHPAFAGVLAREVAARLERLSAAGVSEPYFIVEMGSGNGLLARQLRRSLAERHPRWAGRARFALVERCENLLLESLAGFFDAGTPVLGYARLCDLPPCAGVFYSNELVDALPVHLLEKRDGRVREVYAAPDGRGGLREEAGELSTPELEPHAAAVGPRLEEGGRHGVSLEARRWIREAARAMRAGFLVTIDYGKRFGPEGPNPPRAFYRHTVQDDVSVRPGEQDITASVDFEALIQEGARAGLETVSYSSLSRFLLERGVLEWLPEGADARAFTERSRVKALFHPEGMGEAFKVLIQEKVPSGAREGSGGMFS